MSAVGKSPTNRHCTQKQNKWKMKKKKNNNNNNNKKKKKCI